MPDPRYILLFGGTFDPIHNGHLIMARNAVDLLKADRLIFIPAHISPHKTGERGINRALPAQRLEMIRLAIEGEERFDVDERELHRAGPSYTYDTVSQIRSERPADRFTLLIGQDQLAKLHTWHRIAELQSLVPMAVLPRSFALPEACRLEPVPQVLAMQPVDISATEIRNRIAAGMPIQALLPATVAAYIGRNGLYRPLAPGGEAAAVP